MALLLGSKVLNVQVGWQAGVGAAQQEGRGRQAGGCCMPPPCLSGASLFCFPPVHPVASAHAPPNPQVPFLFKYTVDSLTADPSALTPAAVAGVLALTPPALIVGYGVARAGAALCNEARNAVFAQARAARVLFCSCAGFWG